MPVGNYPYGISITPDGTKLYVANHGSNNISIIDTSTNEVIESVNVGSSPIAFGQFVQGKGTIPSPYFSEEFTQAITEITEDDNGKSVNIKEFDILYLVLSNSTCKWEINLSEGLDLVRKGSIAYDLPYMLGKQGYVGGEADLWEIVTWDRRTQQIKGIGTLQRPPWNTTTYIVNLTIIRAPHEAAANLAAHLPSGVVVDAPSDSDQTDSEYADSLATYLPSGVVDTPSDSDQTDSEYADSLAAYLPSGVVDTPSDTNQTKPESGASLGAHLPSGDKRTHTKKESVVSPHIINPDDTNQPSPSTGVMAVPHTNDDLTANTNLTAKNGIREVDIVGSNTTKATVSHEPEIPDILGIHSSIILLCTYLIIKYNKSKHN